MAAASGAPAQVQTDHWIRIPRESFGTYMTSGIDVSIIKGKEFIRWNSDYRDFEVNATYLRKNGKNIHEFEWEHTDRYQGRYGKHTMEARLDLLQILNKTIEKAGFALNEFFVKAQAEKRLSEANFLAQNQQLLTNEYSKELGKTLGAYHRLKEQADKLAGAPKIETKPNPEFVKKYENEEDEDFAVQFVLDDGSIVNAHKSVLVKSSEKYKIELNSKMQEGQRGENGKRLVHVAGVTKEVFEKYIKFIYTAKIEITENEEAFALWNLAKENGIRDLEKMTAAGALQDVLEQVDIDSLVTREALQAKLTGSADQMWQIYKAESDKADGIFKILERNAKLFGFVREEEGKQD